MKDLIKWLMPYEIRVLDLENGKRFTHKAWTKGGAGEWVHCYRNFGPHVARVERFGQGVMVKGRLV